jgi:hypothetical protein
MTVDCDTLFETPPPIPPPKLELIEVKPEENPSLKNGSLNISLIPPLALLPPLFLLPFDLAPRAPIPPNPILANKDGPPKPLPKKSSSSSKKPLQREEFT